MDLGLQELRTEFIQDKNRIIPNDQELSDWMKTHFSRHDDDDWEKAIEHCKVFTNPRTSSYKDHVFKTKYSVFVYYIDTDWDEFDI